MRLCSLSAVEKSGANVFLSADDAHFCNCILQASSSGTSWQFHKLHADIYDERKPNRIPRLWPCFVAAARHHPVHSDVSGTARLPAGVHQHSSDEMAEKMGQVTHVNAPSKMKHSVRRILRV